MEGVETVDMMPNRGVDIQDTAEHKNKGAKHVRQRSKDQRYADRVGRNI